MSSGQPTPSSKTRPPLPPRPSSSTPAPPPPYSETAPPGSLEPSQSAVDANESWATRDPRTTSTQSLVPSESNEQEARRKLLLIYIHGFMGDETSFRSFPAHVHNLLTVLLAETHVVHTKLYPRYRSKRNIRFARDDFSTWLEPHEDSKTDVVLLGHSMGGLLSAEVVLMGPPAPANRAFKHRILGTINFDVPFLGMHPGVVKSGLSSIFSSTEYEDRWVPEGGGMESSDAISTVSSSGQSGRSDTFWQPPNPDPNYNQRFSNDVVLPVRKGWRNALHFVHKHSKNLNELTKATQNLVTSHMEFGGAMANYTELKTRYARVRVLEEDKDDVRRAGAQIDSTPPRVRFVNYYTVSTGRVKKAKSPTRSPSADDVNASQRSLSPSSSVEDERGRSENLDPNTAPMRSLSPRIAVDEHSDDAVAKKDSDLRASDEDEEDWAEAAESLTIGEDGDHLQSKSDVLLKQDMLSPISTQESLPPIPDLPQRPSPLDLSTTQDPATRKLLEKEYARAIKAYDQAVKEREKTLKARQRLSEKQAKKAGKERLQTETESQQQPQQSQPSDSSLIETTASTSPLSPPPPSTNTAAQSDKPKKEHTFCLLPPKNASHQRDPAWVRIFMENVDEVGAHCGLFFVDERYERLVGEVAERVEGWVREDGDRRMAFV